MFIACRCSGCCRRHHHCRTTPFESSVCCTNTHTDKCRRTEKNASSSLTRAQMPSFTRSEKERNKTQERGTETIGRQESSLPSTRKHNEKANKIRRTWCVVHGFGIFVASLASGNQSTTVDTRPVRQRRKRDPNQPNLFNTILMNLNGSLSVPFAHLPCTQCERRQTNETNYECVHEMHFNFRA